MAESSSSRTSSQAVPGSLHITVRFTTSVPDLPLDVPSPSRTTVVALKQLIRQELTPPTSNCRFRLIYGGKVLADNAILTSVLKVPPPPPRPVFDPKGKGKAKASNEDAPVTRVYINCSIGDELTPAELAAEASAALASADSPSSTTAPGSGGSRRPSQGGPAQPSTDNAPRGFDRLLSAGFTPAEVGQLRLQFMSIQARTHTPDTMPSPSTLRRMEDAWMDDNGVSRTGDAGDTSEISGGALDDLLLGHLTAFFWPLGSMGWLIRQGVWSERRQYAVFTGFMLSLAFGMMHVLS